MNCFQVCCTYMSSLWNLNHKYSIRFFANMTQNSKSNTKLIHDFFETFICHIHPKSSDYLRKCDYYFFFENKFLLSHPHFLQVFTILTLPSIHQPPWTTNLKLLMHQKIDLHSFFLNYYELKTTSLCFLSIFIQKKNSRF